MRLLFLPTLLPLLLTACSDLHTVEPGRGAEREVGPMAKVFPSGEPAHMDRHGLWRGMDGERVVWEVRYTRGLPTGPYREWDAEGNLSATWPFTWEGQMEGWARWFEDGEPGFKIEVQPGEAPDFDPIGRAMELREYFENALSTAETP